jgi:hypothetical protein
MNPTVIVDLLDKVEREEILEEILTDPNQVDDLIVDGKVTSIYDPDYLDSYMDAFLPCVEKILGKKVTPLYSYVRVHGYGSTLKPHTDRDEIHYSLSVPIRYDNPWAICFQDQDCHSIPLGQGLLFAGNKYRHFRPPFLGQEYILAMFMYCDAT